MAIHQAFTRARYLDDSRRVRSWPRTRVGLPDQLLGHGGWALKHSLALPDDDLLGGMWAVIATVFVYRETHRQNIAAALTRSSATLISFALCLTYLTLFSFHPIGLAVVIGLGTFGLIAIGRAPTYGAQLGSSTPA